MCFKIKLDLTSALWKSYVLHKDIDFDSIVQV